MTESWRQTGGKKCSTGIKKGIPGRLGAHVPLKVTEVCAVKYVSIFEISPLRDRA